MSTKLSLSSDPETRDFGLEIIRHRAESLLIVHMDNEEKNANIE